ncbi:hypothetical protein LINPERHAP2_LOCUS30979 [Linum perenne]
MFNYRYGDTKLASFGDGQKNLLLQKLNTSSPHVCFLGAIIHYVRPTIWK